MRKLSILFMCMAFVAGMTAICQASTGKTSGGGAVSITDASNPTLTFSPSPNVEMSWNTAGNEFAIISQNDKTPNVADDGADANGLVFGVFSGYSGYWQQQKLDGTGIGDVGNSDDTDFSTGWTQMGGSS